MQNYKNESMTLTNHGWDAMSLGRRVKMLREEKGLSQEQLAKLVGVTQQTIQKIENVASKKSLYILELADALEVDPYLLKYGKTRKLKKESLEFSDKKLTLSAIPLLYDIEVIDWVKNNKLPEKHKSIPMMGILANTSEKVFCMEVKNSAMVSIYNAAHSYYPGEFILVDSEKKPRSGSVVVALIDGKDLKIRKYEQDGNETQLKAYDTVNYPHIKVDDNVEILGVVIQKVALIESENID